MKVSSVCVLGGSGFVGGHLVASLNNAGKRVRVLTRRRERHKRNLVCPGVEIVETDVRESSDLARQFEGMDTVIFLAGILNETHHDHFREVHVEFPRRVVDAAIKAKVKRILHMSALNADTAQGVSDYLRSKGEGEDVMHLAAGAGIAVTSFRPSVIFGSNDSFFNRFANLLRLGPCMPLACPKVRFAPVYVGDVASAFVKSLENEATHGERIELCGPETLTLEELVKHTAEMIGLRRMVLPLSDGLSRTMASLLQFAPGKPMTPDNFRSMQLDSVCNCNGLARLGIAPKSIDAIMPMHFQRSNETGRFDLYRRSARRS